jgi:hypothetical protein
MIIILWLLIGVWTAFLVAGVAREERLSPHWAWWPVLVVLGPVTPLLALGVVLWRWSSQLEEKWRN